MSGPTHAAPRRITPACCSKYISTATSTVCVPRGGWKRSAGATSNYCGSPVAKNPRIIRSATSAPSIEFAATNPFDDYLTVFYTANEPGTIEIRLLNVNTGAISTLLSASEIEVGEYQLIQESGAIASGTYSVQVIFSNNLFTKTIIKP